jgi:hypothetical protein
MIFDIEKDGEIYKIGESFSSKSPSKAGLKRRISKTGSLNTESSIGKQFC